MDSQTITQAETINRDLFNIEKELDLFLDYCSIGQILKENPTLEEDYIRLIFKEFRYLSVYCGEGRKAIEKLLHSGNNDQKLFDQVYKGIYKKCIIEFFSPQDDLWYEDSRASYKNKSSIDLQYAAGNIVENLLKKLEPSFQIIRETLDYLEL